MTKRTYDVYECDRCGHVETITDPRQTQEWSKITAYQVAPGARKIAPVKPDPASPMADICPTCSDTMFAWWNAGKRSRESLT